MRHRLVHLSAATLIAVAALSSPARADGPTAPSPCSGVIQITSLAFSPASVSPGQTSTATLSAWNCTNQTLQTTSTWQGQFVSATGTGIPAGCPAIDPLPRPLTFPPHTQVSAATTYLVPASCTATRLHLTVKISSSSGVLASRSADLVIRQP